MTASPPVFFDNSYARLSGGFFSPQRPTPVKAPANIRVNVALAAQLGIDPDWLTSAEATEVFA
ncbi:MAG TPA: hypothetical protein VFM32_04750, partial [Spongiibacteraceae bacterium]|nr:hypothetical protein [Spongiibacteraceae bacterium]